MEIRHSLKCTLEIKDIPNEMLEKIFETLFISGYALSLLRCREVCKLWKHRVEQGILKSKQWNEKLWFNICKQCVQRNTALEFLNIGTLRIKGQNSKDVDLLAKEINSQSAPDIRKLSRIDGNADNLINLTYEDGCLVSGEAVWRRLFIHCMSLTATDNFGSEVTNAKSNSRNFRTDTLEPDPVTSIKISGDMIITGHSSGTIWFWTTSGNSLDCIPVVQSGSELRDCIKSIHLIDAYKNEIYKLKDMDGHSISTNHHAIVVLSTCGNVYFCALYISQINASYNDVSSEDTTRIHEKFASRFKSIAELQNWKISCVNVYGDVIIAGTSLGGKIFLLRLKTSTEFCSNPFRVPELQNIRVLSFTDISPILSSGVFQCNLWHLNCSSAWYWQCITLIHRTGSVYRCHLPSLSEANHHQPSWKRFAEIQHQYTNDSILFENGYRYDWDQVPFHLILPYHSAEDKSHIQGFACHSSVHMKKILIGKINYAILPINETLDLLRIKHFSMTNQDDVFESCSIYRDDVFILMTRASKQMLVSVDGYYYKVYSPLKTESFNGSYVSAMHYSSNLLVLGTSDGRVKAYTISGINGILDLDLEKPSWEEEAGIWSFGSPVSHIDIGLLSRKKTRNLSESVNTQDESVSIVIAYENNSMTLITRSLKLTESSTIKRLKKIKIED